MEQRDDRGAGPEPGQRAVVGPAALAEPRAVGRDEQRRDDDDVGLGDRVDAARRVAVLGPVEVASPASSTGSSTRTPRRRERVEQVGGRRLGAVGDVGGDDRGVARPRRGASTWRSRPVCCGRADGGVGLAPRRARALAPRRLSRVRPCRRSRYSRRDRSVGSPAWQPATTRRRPTAGAERVGRDSVAEVVIPTAGRGTRFLPATKAVPKELLPVVDRPSLEYVVEEAAARRAARRAARQRAGQGRGRGPLRRGATTSSRCSRTRATTTGWPPCVAATELADVSAVLPGRAARARSRGAVRRRPRRRRAVPREPARHAARRRHRAASATMVAVREQHGGSVIALYEVPRDQIEKYGIAAVEATDDRPTSCASPGWSRSRRSPRRRATSRSSAATCSTRRVFDVLRTDRAGSRRRDPAHRRDPGARRDGPARRSTPSSSAATSTTPATSSST